MAMNFSSFEGLAMHLGEVMLHEHDVVHHGLDEAAKLIQKRAKEKLGEYQDESGPFSGWAELADSTKDQRVQQGYTENDPGLRSGEMRDSIERKVEGHEAAIGSNDDKMVYFELGTTKQPPRSVLGAAAVETADEAVKIIGDRYVSLLIGHGVAGGGMVVRANGATPGQFLDEIE